MPNRFAELIATVTREIDGLPVVPSLSEVLEATFPADGATFTEIEKLCRQGIAEGWLCARAHGGIKFGRILKPSPVTHGFSVDVVEMEEVEGPHHAHPNGEIDLIMPIDEHAEFDGQGRGWKVYGPHSAHHPTVRGGKAMILYLLPEGAIDFAAASTDANLGRA